MTSYETNATQAQWAKGQSSSSGSDFKKLKSKYASQLSTLKELFANWSDEDLLFAIQDADGDLELTIERISEGHVVQWGEVKTKKQKKEAAQKAKASQPASQQFTSSSSSTYNRERAHAARNHSERGRSGRGGSANRGNARTSKPPVAPHPQTAASWEKKTKAHHSSESQSFDKGGSWASIVSAPKTTVNDNSQIGNAATTGADGWDTPAATTTDDNWAKPTWDDQPQPESAPAPSPPPSTSANNDTSSSSAPKTWASLLKSKPKPEPSVDTKKEDQQGWQQSEAASTGDGRDAPKDGWNTAKSNENDAWTTPSADPWEQPVQMTSDAPPLKGEPVPEKTPEAKEEEPSSVAVEAINSSEKEQLSSSSPSSAANKAKQSVGRRLRQDAPVVLPNSGATMSDVEVKFGSLGLEDSTEGDVRLGEPTKKQDSSATVDQAAEKQANQSYLDRYPSNENGSAGQGANSLIGGESLGQASYIKQQDAATAAAANYIPQQPPQQQPQQQQQQQLNHLQQQHFGMENLTSPYSSYLPNQPPAGVSGFAMNPMASLPDYSLYGSDAQRAAASMGYYDPSAYSHSPSTTSASAYQARDKYGQDAASANAQTQMLPQQAQQMYPNMPYYHQYYYMPNHLFGAYQQSGYAQPYLNKNMYPMYQPSGKPGASATSPYGAAGGSPYVNHQTQQQHLYNPTIPGAAGYDDMSPLGALHDYQKPSYNQQQPQQQVLPGFLGNLPQPSPGAQQPPANAGQQGQGKADVDNGQYAGNGSQQGANTQHFPQQHAYQQPNPSNYFNHHQPQQMFYPQQQFHMQPHQQQQQQQQQQAPQAPSMGRQQQYWNQ